jgi:tripartite-type tricarboxylate transporter receptor subunit TctC
MPKRALAVGFVLVLSLLSVPRARAQEEVFYKGKTIKVLVGTTAGSLYDLWARTIAAHIGKHIPGNPETLTQNMPGAGHKVATNYLYNVAKPDGLTIIGSILPGVYIDQLVGRPEVKYDWAKFAWIGSPVKSESQMTMRSDAPYKSFDDLRNAKEPARCGTTGTGTDYMVSRLLEEAIPPLKIHSYWVIRRTRTDLAWSAARSCAGLYSRDVLREPYITGKERFRTQPLSNGAEARSRLADTRLVRAHGPLQDA